MEKGANCENFRVATGRAQGQLKLRVRMMDPCSHATRGPADAPSKLLHYYQCQVQNGACHCTVRKAEPINFATLL